MGIIGGIIGRVLDHEINKRIYTILETRTGYNQKVPLYNSPGDASVPCKDDRILIIKIDGTTGNYAAIGMLVEAQGAKPGEKIFYSRDSNGNMKAILKMLNNGEIHLNDNGKKAARAGDTVKIKIPASTFIVSVSGGSGAPAVGTPNITDMEFDGEIVSGSDTTFIGD